MSILEEIKRAIREIAKENGEAKNMVFEAEVVSVQDETISVRSEEMELTEVRTCSVTDGNSRNLRIYPKVGSTVVCLDIGGDRRDIIVLQYSEIDRISIHEGRHTSVNADLLVEQLKNLTGRVDALYQGIQQAVPTPQDGGSAILTTIKAKIAGKQSEDYSKVEDETLMH